jgi:phage baseplate assembly protein W|tara:strand:- start:91 stop:486 length:396 start_codon:yes stop_codon:yes gene_type:complete
MANKQIQNDFSDFNNSMVTKGDGDLAKTVDEFAVAQSIKNLILTDKMERPFQPTLGCDIRKSLFENFTPQTITVAKQRIAETIGQYEPRAEIINIEASPDEDNNALNMTIVFSLINSDVEQTLGLVLERIR